MKSTLRLLAKSTKASKKTGPSVRDESVQLLRSVLFEVPNENAIHMDKESWKKHEIINRAWGIYQSRKEKELGPMQDACEELRLTSETLFNASMTGSKSRRFPIQTRIPTDTPPRFMN
ncbi:ribosomal protein subunit L28 [Schizosaccharomyces cryophilus OY26]|uniref:Large ribosomal subunit protein mL40 n=1 Tax=Schizosaccharomyces cryophilus (strain OY26 / ATCC MYA-4695 / CBS 11777 / NBRC 106824 / NRRL Y48691) TaxID=653667 RepID=S9XFN0_SCHCR|nr:ribosomal protein subunit L28 [Schizosaccharomyces cryophilus OY26]EPY52446.1 ribosomal protein subunit L28 [Schizosaccharomyces cryophilus OY26]